MKHQHSRLLLLVPLLVAFVSGCVSPVTPQSMPWQQPQQHFAITPVSPGLYQMDQFVVTFEGLTAMLQNELARGHHPDIVILDSLLPMHEEELRIAKLAEKHQLRVFTQGIVGLVRTSSYRLQWQAEDLGYVNLDTTLKNQ